MHKGMLISFLNDQDIDLPWKERSFSLHDPAKNLSRNFTIVFNQVPSDIETDFVKG